MTLKGIQTKTIRMKLLIPIVCAIFAGELLIGYISYKMTSDVITRVGTADGLHAVQSLRQVVASEIANTRHDLSAIASAPTFQDLLLEEKSREAVETYMHKLVARQPLYSAMFVLNSRGIVVAAADNITAGAGSIMGRDLSEEAYFKASMKGDSFISPVETSKRIGRLVMLISIPVRDWEDGSVIGVVAAAMRVEEINTRHVVPVAMLGGHGYAMFVDREGGVIVGHRNANRMGERIPEELQQRLATIGDKQTVLEAVVDGTPSMLFVERGRLTRWLGIMVCPIDDFYTLTRYLAWLKILFSCSTILLLTGVVWLTVRGITQALSTTISYASAVSHGELDTPLLVQRRDEVGTLAQSLRDMVSTLKSMIAVAEEKTNEAEAAAEAIISSIVYASKIQRSLLPKEHVFQNAFSDYSVVWNPRDIVGGDIYWAKTFNNGTVLCVCDCTGHGTSGALLTMLVASALDSTVEEHNCRDTAAIMWHLEKSLVHVLSMDIGALGTNGNAIRDGCDLALLFVARDGSVTLSSSHTHVFVCDGNEVNQIRGQNIYIGEGRLTSKDDIRITNIPANPDNKFYIASDGLFDQPGGASKNPFGYTAFKRIILENHGEKQSVISARICAAFEEYRGMEPRVDDFELITFKP